MKWKNLCQLKHSDVKQGTPDLRRLISFIPKIRRAVIQSMGWPNPIIFSHGPNIHKTLWYLLHYDRVRSEPLREKSVKFF